jgi:3',5'-cyclic AMP phosphodiesterase CpdA
MRTLDKLKPGIQKIEQEEIRLPGIRKVTLIGDAGCTGFDEASRKILGQLLKHESDLYFILGDLAFTGAEEEFQEVIDFFNSRVQAPVFALRGNHDIANYEKFLGLSTYAVVLDRFVCLFLNNGTGCFPDEDLAFLSKELDKHPDRNFLLFMHVPPPTDIHRSHMPQAEWGKLKAVLDQHRERISHIFCAHIHGYHHYELDGYPVTITAGGGAAMIHDLKSPEQKFHHAVVVHLGDNGHLTTELVIVRDGA